MRIFAFDDGGVVMKVRYVFQTLPLQIALAARIPFPHLAGWNRQKNCPHLVGPKIIDAQFFLFVVKAPALMHRHRSEISSKGGHCASLVYRKIAKDS